MSYPAIPRSFRYVIASLTAVPKPRNWASGPHDEDDTWYRALLDEIATAECNAATSSVSRHLARRFGVNFECELETWGGGPQISARSR